MKHILSNIRLKLAGFLLLFKIPSVAGQSDINAFENEINYYRQIDSSGQIQPNPILFLGSSSIKNWHQFDTIFKDLNCINRGFGGSKIEDVIYYADDVIFKYQPRQIVIYVGENDFAAFPSPSPQIVFARFDSLFRLIREHFPETPVIYIGIKPSPAKRHVLHNISTYNRMVSDYLADKPNTTFIDMYSKMLDATGKPDANYFTEDFTHMNENGYALWNSIIIPILLPVK